MPDDRTLAHPLGTSSMSGLRRAHRMAYVGEEVSQGMPSVTSSSSIAFARQPPPASPLRD